MDYFTEDALPMAVGYARAAAAAGHAAGLHAFGFMLVRGKGVEEDRDEALELFRAAAAKGDAYGAFNAAVAQGEGNCRADRDEYLRLLTQPPTGASRRLPRRWETSWRPTDATRKP
ncbi:SEL1-like repeat protein [Kitasatospora sp. NPDC048545]|uniref:SEL1-like repeat protein n=1 Tax=Kitasatospora sp. NPDC048545 TaxID=3157208 RepID=UPI0033D7F954